MEIAFPRCSRERLILRKRYHLSKTHRYPEDAQ